MFLPHLASRLYGTPLLLARSKLDIILSVLGERIGWQPSALESMNSAPSAKFTRSDAPSLLNSAQDLSSVTSGIAVIGITGSLVRRNIGIEAQSGLMSYAEIGQNLELAVNDPSISGILLEIDSPGGEAGGVFELAQRIREIDAIKPVWALACDSAFSAAYALACAASRVLVTQTSGLGSIGVIAMHVDQSVRDAQQGYRFTAVTAGDFKGDLSPHEPLAAGSAARLQAEVDRLYGLFVDHVATMRAIAPKAVRATQAACYFGSQSIDVGLADALVRADQVIAEFASYLSQRRFQRLASQVISTTAGAFAPTPTSTQSQISNVTPKEFLMTQDQQSQTAPVPDRLSESPPQTSSENLPDTTQLPVSDSVAREVEPAHAEPAPNPAPDPATQSAQAGRIEALEIAELCQLAGQSNRIAGFLAQGISASQVRQALLLSRSQSEEITSLIHPDAVKPVAKATSDGSSALLAAVKKLSGSP